LCGYFSFKALGAYSVSKTALLGLTKVLAQEVGHTGIRVNCISPGVIQTKFSSMVINDNPCLILTPCIHFVMNF
jgi:dehydrogenase/reductase SDR family protein 4